MPMVEIDTMLWKNLKRMKLDNDFKSLNEAVCVLWNNYVAKKSKLEKELSGYKEEKKVKLASNGMMKYATKEFKFSEDVKDL